MTTDALVWQRPIGTADLHGLKDADDGHEHCFCSPIPVKRPLLRVARCCWCGTPQRTELKREEHGPLA